MLPLDCIYQIALWANFKTTIAIIGSCKSLFALRKKIYLEKQLLKNDNTINHWSPEENYYASINQFTTFNVKEHNVRINFHEVNNSLLKWMKDHHYRIIIATLIKPWVCLWDEHILRYYNTLDELLEEELYVTKIVKTCYFINLANSKPCYTKWDNPWFTNHGYIDSRGLVYNKNYKL